MSGNKYKIGLVLVAVLDIATLVTAVSLLGGLHLNFQLLNPKGVIAAGEKSVLITAVLLMLIVVVPVLGAAVIIARKYRADRASAADYDPNWQGSGKLQIVWWAFPGTIIVLLAALTWKSSHALDPYKPIQSNVQPITIEVVALEWKWLFIYPEQRIAMVNYVEFPVNTPVNFELTADAPMSSFWIPQLGGQIYAMTGMNTRLHLMAGEQGTYNGEAAEINGPGFSGMTFKAKAASNAEFEQWTLSVQKDSKTLDFAEYEKLAQPTTDNAVVYYGSADPSVYYQIIQKFNGPPGVRAHGGD